MIKRSYTIDGKNCVYVCADCFSVLFASYFFGEPEQRSFFAPIFLILRLFRLGLHFPSNCLQTKLGNRMVEFIMYTLGIQRKIILQCRFFTDLAEKKIVLLYHNWESFSLIWLSYKKSHQENWPMMCFLLHGCFTLQLNLLDWTSSL